MGARQTRPPAPRLRRAGRQIETRSREDCALRVSRKQVDWGAYASRVSAMASRHRELFLCIGITGKPVSAKTPKPTRETRVLPRLPRTRFLLAPNSSAD